jgi:hypothetical protein
MSLIYLPKHNFDLGNNSNIILNLSKARISEEKYIEHIQPFFESLPGFYFAKGPQLRNNFLLPRIRFSVNGISLSKTLDYVLKNTCLLEIPLQDSYSVRIENQKTKKISEDDKEFIKSGLAIQKYSKQNGTLHIFREDDFEYRRVSLA